MRRAASRAPYGQSAIAWQIARLPADRTRPMSRQPRSAALQAGPGGRPGRVGPCASLSSALPYWGSRTARIACRGRWRSHRAATLRGLAHAMTRGPMSLPADPPCQRRTPLRYEPAAVALDQSAWSPASSSVVDDNSHVRAELQHCPGHEGFGVLTALEGDHVLQLLHVQPIEAITPDGRTPHPDGLEVWAVCVAAAQPRHAAGAAAAPQRCRRGRVLREGS
jgi:hypothetical protein